MLCVMTALVRSDICNNVMLPCVGQQTGKDWKTKIESSEMSKKKKLVRFQIWLKSDILSL